MREPVDTGERLAGPGKNDSASGRGGSTKLRNPSLPEMRTDGAGRGAGEECGVVRGPAPPCRIVLDAAGGCPSHCRAATRNPDALSALCPNRRSRGRDRCPLHGGRTRVGTGHPGYSDGKRSRWAPHVSPARRALAASMLRGDPLDLSDDLAVARTRVAELLAAADAHGVPDYAAALPLADRAIVKLNGGDTDAARLAMGELRGVLEKSRALDATWERITGALKETTRMVESQRKRAIEGHKYVTAEDVQDMFNQLGRSLKKRAEELLDKETSNRLLTEIGADWAAQAGVTPANDATGDGDPAS